MSSYIGMVHITGSDPVLVGSTLYGICNTAAATAAKTVLPADASSVTSDNSNTDFINNNYDQLLKGTTVHIKFVNGNTATSGLTLQIGSVATAQNIVGNCTCPAGTIISFTLDENQNWVTNDNVDTNTEYVFAGNTPYNASTNKALAESSVSAAAHKDVVTDLGANTSSTDLPTAAAVATYVQNMTGGLAGLTGAMHFRGTSTVAIHDGDGASVDPTINGYDFRGNGDNAGDVVLWNAQEYVWTGTSWELLGDEGSYALKDSVDTITEVGVFTTNTLPTLTVADTNVSQVSVTNGSAASLTTNNVTIPNVTSAGSPAQASVSAGILNITLGQAPTIAATPITVKEVNVFTANTPTVVTATPVSLQSSITFTQGTQASLTTNDTTVVVPVAPNP